MNKRKPPKKRSPAQRDAAANLAPGTRGKKRMTLKFRRRYVAHQIALGAPTEAIAEQVGMSKARIVAWCKEAEFLKMVEAEFQEIRAQSARMIGSLLNQSLRYAWRSVREGSGEYTKLIISLFGRWALEGPPALQTAARRRAIVIEDPDWFSGESTTAPASSPTP